MYIDIYDMFPFSELKTVQIEITTKCQASCPMCARNIRGGPVNPNLKMADWTLAEFKTIFNKEVCNQIETVIFCGSFGEPIVNSDLLAMCQYLQDMNSNLAVRIHTNGSAKNQEWWKSLATSLPVNHMITFGIDGLEDTHSVHRKGTDFNQILRNAKAFISAGGQAEWSYIKFKHNEHQVDQAKTLATEYGFKSFIVKNSIRFNGDQYDVLDLDKKIVYNIKPPSDNVVRFVDKDIIKNYNNWFDNVQIDCHVLKYKEIYIDAYKNMFPCCWIASAPYLYNEPESLLYPYKEKATAEVFDLIESLGGFNSIDLTTKTIKQVMEMPTWSSVWKKYWNEKILVCAKNCGNTELTNTADQVITRIDV